MSSAYVEIVRRAVEEGWNRGDLDLLDQVYAPDCVSHPVSPGGVTGRGIEAQREYLRQVRSIFPDFQASIEEIYSAGDRVTFRWVASGTHQGEWMGVAPTGKRIAWGGITMCRLAGDRIQEDWMAADMVGVLDQLGVLQGTQEPPPLRLLEHSGTRFQGPDGRQQIVAGWVENVSSGPLEGLEVVVTMYDREGKTLCAQRSSLPAVVLQPGQACSFKVRVAEITEPCKRYDIRFEQGGIMVGVKE